MKPFLESRHPVDTYCEPSLPNFHQFRSSLLVLLLSGEIIPQISILLSASHFWCYSKRSAARCQFSFSILSLLTLIVLLFKALLLPGISILLPVLISCSFRLVLRVLFSASDAFDFEALGDFDELIDRLAQRSILTEDKKKQKEITKYSCYQRFGS